MDRKEIPQTIKENLIFIAHRRESDQAKQDLWDHLEDTASLAGTFAGKIGLQKAGELMGLLHDLGKATTGFQHYIMSAMGLLDPDADGYVDAEKLKGKIDHASAGAQIIYKYLYPKGKEYLFLAQITALAIASHHSGLIDCLAPDGMDQFSKRMDKTDELTRTAEAEQNLDARMRNKLQALLNDPSAAGQFNHKLQALQESNDCLKTYMFKIGLLTRFLFSCLLDADRINTVDFEFPENKKLRNQGTNLPWETLIKKFEHHISGFKATNKVNLWRQEISSCCLEYAKKPKGIYQLTVPTGGGKTLASLRYALHHAAEYKMDRIFYIIPYTSIIDQNADEVRKILETKLGTGEYTNQFVLEHHSNLTPDKENTRQKLLAENWDAPIVFTTMVQFLETMFGRGTRSARRMHQSANAVLIFDEIQTLPIRCTHLFNLAIRFLVKECQSTVVLCTATQPLLDKVKPESRALNFSGERQIVENYEQLFQELNRVEVINRQKAGGWSTAEIAGLATEELALTGSVLIVVNTKKLARDLYERLRTSPKADVYHLSTYMCPAHRRNILQQVKACLPDIKPVICISTQLIEAGVDVDFGSVIRYTAGLDSISQAAGRCNRNGTRQIQGRVIIVNPQEENLAKLKDIAKGKEVSLRIFDEYAADPGWFQPNILGPKAMERYYLYYFHQRMSEMSYPLDKKSKTGREEDLFNLLSDNELSLKNYHQQNKGKSAAPWPLRQSFKTAAEEFKAIDSAVQGIIVPYKEGKELIVELCGAIDLQEQAGLLKQAQHYAVNVYPYQLDELLLKKVVHETQKGSGIYYLDTQYYDKNYGLSSSRVGDLEPLIFGEV